MKIIDAHVHIFPEKIASSAVIATNQFYSGALSDQVHAPKEFTIYKGTAEDLIERSKKAGIARSVVFSTATAPRQVESINSFIARNCQAHPEFIGVGTMHIDYPDFAGEVQRLKSHIAKLFPEMRFVAAHFGGWSQWAEARECLVLPNVYVDTSSTLGFADSDAAIKGFETFDPTHIFFGSDYPMWEPGIELERLLALKLDDALLSRVLWENFENFLTL